MSKGRGRFLNKPLPFKEPSFLKGAQAMILYETPFINSFDSKVFPSFPETGLAAWLAASAGEPQAQPPEQQD